MHFSGIQLTLTYLPLSRTFHALEDYFFFKHCIDWELQMQASEFKQLRKFPCTMPNSHAIRAAGYYVLQNPKLGSWKAARNHLSENNQEWFVCIPHWDIYLNFNTEMHGCWESANILICVLICVYIRFCND